MAVIGCGTFANKQYLPYIREEANAEIVATVDIVEERAIKACEKFNIRNYYKSVIEACVVSDLAKQTIKVEI